MNIELLQKELKNHNTYIKNGNELYVDVTNKNVKEIVGSLLSLYKLNFAAEFCVQHNGFVINVLFTSRKCSYYVIVKYSTENTIISLQNQIYQANIFEREISDLFGLKIEGGMDVRNIVKHENWEKDIFPLRKEFPYGNKVKYLNESEEYKFKELSGEGGYQIAVGPVHAGIIEPGHFRFSVMGEQIENLEIRLMYKHRGIEKTLENVDVDKLNLIFERVSGDSSVAYSEIYALLIEKLNNCSVSEDIKAIRVILLELERIYNFLEDLGGICTDIGFSYPAKKFSYFSELFHQLCERITGSRFLRNSIVPLGNNVYFDQQKSLDILGTIAYLSPRLNRMVEITLNSVSFLDRVEHTGIVRNDKAVKLGLTGITGRASGVIYDVRNSFNYELYKNFKRPVKVETMGGALERFKLKIDDINYAFDYIKKSATLIKGTVQKQKNKVELKENMEAVVSVETVKGELIVYGLTGKENKFSRIYLKTPSFVNWNGLTYAILNEIVPDFPLCNKSFNMSYSENDR